MIDFAKCFEILTENPPFAWQIKLYERFLTDEIPASCDIPTGLGKTSVIVIWLLALAEKLIENPQENKVPRRLVYVVDRRVIVDQATKEAEKILKKLRALKRLSLLKEKHWDLQQIFDVLKNISFLQDNKNMIALSTLRGEYADNREWCLDPSRPAIIIGTIDMIGSRLLFSAYGGVGESYKALQAGLLGQDSLLVIDEAHLSPAFMEMLRPLKNLVNRKNTIKRFEIMSLSATPLIDEESEPFTLEKDAPEDLTNPIAESRLNADKFIEWKSFPVAEDILKSKKVVELLRIEQAKEMANVAAQYKELPVSVVIFGREVELVKKIQTELIDIHKVGKNQVRRMTGGMRGFERDNLVKDKVFERFDPNRKRSEEGKAFFLIATSVAEVGVNLDADFAVCDITSADSFIQRLGRINRFGKNSAVVTIVHDESLEKSSEQAKFTFQTLRQFENLNASPLELRRIEFDKKTCYPPKPVSPPLDKAKIDDWAMTSLTQDDFRRPLVSYWLRGVTENTSTETSLCWRADLKFADTDRRKIATVKTVRVKSRECARESTARAEKTILALAARFPDERIVFISSGNDYEVLSLGELTAFKDQSGKNELFPKLMFATVVLPCEVGGLEKGIAVDELPKETESVSDVVNQDEWQRAVFTERENGVERIVIGGETEFFEEKRVEELITDFAGKSLRCVKQITMKLSSSDEESEEEHSPKKRIIAYFISKKSPEAYLPNEAESSDDTESETASIGFEEDKAKQIKGEISVEEHNSDVAKAAEKLANKLHLDDAFVETLRIAGAWHDRGKARECWQKAVGNFRFPDKVLAKSNQNWFGHKYNNFYRHEFGSLIEAEENEEIKNHPRRDLILHLIASHHGYARPHFPERAFDRENPKGANFEVAERVMLRFANLQIEYGWWQLAYLEAVLKAADALASRAEARGEKI
jgi:CRISPR-associated endonuclease/helicase Cas3